MTETELKVILRGIKENNYLIQDENFTYDDLTKEMLHYIGAKDPELRDELICEVSGQWIEDERYSDKQLEDYLMICLDENHLTYGLGDEDQESVFTRTFSALFISCILWKHNEKSFLSNETLHLVKDKFITYYKAEKDMRGYLTQGGWAHSVAHGADVIVQLAKSEVFCEKDLKQLLDALKTRICQGKYVFTDREPERICVAVRTIMNRHQLSDEYMEQWLNGLQEDEVDIDQVESWHQWINIQNVYKTLYFALKSKNETYGYLSVIEKMISVL